MTRAKKIQETGDAITTSGSTEKTKGGREREFFPLSLTEAHPLAAHYLPAMRPARVHVGILTSGRGRPAANGTLVFWKPTTLLVQTGSTKTSPRNPVILMCPTIWQIASRALPRRRIMSAIRERDRSRADPPFLRFLYRRPVIIQKRDISLPQFLLWLRAALSLSFSLAVPDSRFSLGGVRYLSR